MTTAPGRFPFGWNRTSTSAASSPASSSGVSTPRIPTTIPIAVYQELSSGSPELIITSVSGGQEITLDETFKNSVTSGTFYANPTTLVVQAGKTLNQFDGTVTSTKLPALSSGNNGQICYVFSGTNGLSIAVADGSSDSINESLDPLVLPPSCGALIFADYINNIWWAVLFLAPSERIPGQIIYTSSGSLVAGSYNILTASATSMTLPSAALNAGKSIVAINDIGSSATITRFGSDTIVGGTTSTSYLFEATPGIVTFLASTVSAKWYALGRLT